MYSKSRKKTANYTRCIFYMIYKNYMNKLVFISITPLLNGNQINININIKTT